MSDEDALWYSIPIFGWSLFFSARYFGYYRTRRWLRWLLLVTAVLIMAFGVVGGFIPGTRHWQ